MKILFILITLLFSLSVSASYEALTDIKLKDIKDNTYNRNDLVYLQETASMLELSGQLPMNCDKGTHKSCQIECDDYTKNVSIMLHGTDKFGQVYILAYLNDDRLYTIKANDECYYRNFVPLPLLTK